MSSLFQAPLIEKLFATKPFDQMTLRSGETLRPGVLRRKPICAITTANGLAASWLLGMVLGQKTVRAPGELSARDEVYKKAGVSNSKEGKPRNSSKFSAWSKRQEKRLSVRSYQRWDAVDPG